MSKTLPLHSEYFHDLESCAAAIAKLHKRYYIIVYLKDGLYYFTHLSEYGKKSYYRGFAGDFKTWIS